MNEKNPAVRKTSASEVTNEAIASPLPDFASCSAGESCDTGLASPEGMNSLTLSLVNDSGLDPKVAERTAIFCKVEDDFDNYPSYRCDS